ncbi:hypothetical protein HK102_011407, partial [Quaeritorhiza haematococci]
HELPGRGPGHGPPRQRHPAGHRRRPQGPVRERREADRRDGPGVQPRRRGPRPPAARDRHRRRRPAPPRQGGRGHLDGPLHHARRGVAVGPGDLLLRLLPQPRGGHDHRGQPRGRPHDQLAGRRRQDHLDVQADRLL